MREMGIPNVWETYISVDNAEMSLAKAKTAGGTPMGPVMTPFMGSPQPKWCCAKKRARHTVLESALFL
ncbi:MAG: hypothetical protein F4138_03820 [Acidimicrobiia bacterium]|nr:hypothetical protein [Acidimicrobiia bacterium]